MSDSYFPKKYICGQSDRRVHISLTADDITARLVYYDCIGGECDMDVYELSKKYFPRMWDKSRLEALVAAGRLTEAEMEEIIKSKE